MRTALVTLATGVVADPEWLAFTNWKDQYNMVFESGEEDMRRYKIFSANMKKAADLTAKSKGKAQYGATKFAHLTKEEFTKHHTGFKPKQGRKLPKQKVFPTNKNFKATSIDWRTKGAVSPVKNQGQCGSCWAFSATEAIESAFWKATGEMKILAPQQIVSCDSLDFGCGGGDTVTAYTYVELAGGLEGEKDYPYKSGTTERDGRCKSQPSEFEVQVTGSETISSDPGTESNMYRQIEESPMSICVDAESWQLYMGGVVDSSTCGTQLDHCVHLIGANFEEGYWIVKNSWAADWGEDGCIRVKTGEDACGIAEEATIVTAEAAWGNKASITDSTADAIDFIRGLSEGFGLTMEDRCITGTEGVMREVEAAYTKMQEKTPIAMAEAMEMLADALRIKWPAACEACNATKDQLKKILASLGAFTNPRAFIYHVGQDLIINGIDIFQKMNESVAHMKKKEYHEGGFSLGKAMAELVVGEDVVYV